MEAGPRQAGTARSRRGSARRGRPRPVGVMGAVLASAGLACSAAPAAASVSIGPGQITVQGAGASAVITRAPFQIAFKDAGGQTVLSEVPAPGAGTLKLPPALPGVPSQPTGPALYAPLSFLLGSVQPAVFTEGELEGDLASVEETGQEYSAEEVLSAEPEGEGVALTLKTNDPSGRTLAVTIAPQGAGAIRLSARPSDPAGVAAMADSFSSGVGEAFHGFGGRHNALDQHGQDFYNWLDQENVGGGSPETLQPDGPQAAYYVQSSFISNQGYGFLLDRPELSRWRLGSDRPEAWQTQVAAPAIDYVVAPGSMAKAAGTLSAITGRQRMPPAWGLGPMLDREVEYGVGAARYEAQVEEDLREIVARHLPVEAYRIEGWHLLSRPFLESVITRLHALGIHPLLYFRAFVGEDAGTDEPAQFTTAVQNGYVTRTAGGQPYIFTSNFSKPAALIDFTNPAAVAWWKGRIDAALELGADGFMLDFGEQVQPDMHFSDGSTGAQMHNRYPVVYQQVTRTILDEYEALHPGRQLFFFTRSGYTGAPGTAAYENANFPGDETTDWGAASGLQSLAPDMLNRAVGGAFGFATDIGGYLDVTAPRTSRELFLRWAEWAALSPVFRLHGAVFVEHTPWSPTIHAVVIYRELSKLHLAAAGAISALWREADETGVPVTRPLYLAYPNDPVAAAQEQEWLLGPDILVAPVVQQGARSRGVYFPEGCWRNPETGQEVLGPQSVTVTASIAQLPFYFRCTTTPFKPPGRFGRSQP